MEFEFASKEPPVLKVTLSLEERALTNAALAKFVTRKMQTNDYRPVDNLRRLCNTFLDPEIVNITIVGNVHKESIDVLTEVLSSYEPHASDVEAETLPGLLVDLEAAKAALEACRDPEAGIASSLNEINAIVADFEIPDTLEGLAE